VSWTAGVQFPKAAIKEIFLFASVLTDSRGHPASYSQGTEGSVVGNKAAGAWSWPLTSI